MNYVDLYTETANRLGDSTDSTLLSNCQAWINQQYMKVIRELMAYTDVEYLTKQGTFTPNSDNTYTFPSYVGDIVDIRNNVNRLKKVRIPDLDTIQPNRATAGTPYWYYSLGTTPIYQQPSAASYISMASTSSSDLTQQVTIRGLLSGVEQVSTMTLSAANTVATTIQFDELYSINKSDTTAGTVTVIANSGTLSCSILAPSVLENTYIKIGVYPLNSSLQHSYTYTPTINNMTADNDVPNLPIQFHYILIDGAEAIGRRWMEEFDSARECELRFLSGIEELKGFVKNLNEYQMSMTQPYGRYYGSPWDKDNFMA